MTAGERVAPTALQSQQRIEAVWRQRADRLSQRPTLGGTAQNAVPVVVLGIGNERYAIDLQYVAEVFPPVRPTPVPGAAAVFSGVLNVHGEIRPVIDLRRLLNIDAVENGNLPRVILLRKEGRETGLQIDTVEQIRWIGAGDLQSAGEGAAGSSPYIQGLTKDLLMLLSTDALFAEIHSGVTT